MAYPVKPTPVASVLVTGHSLAQGLLMAILANEGTGITLADYSLLGNHMSCSNISAGSWVDDGGGAWYINVSKGAAVSPIMTPTAQSAINRTAAEAWTELLICASRAGTGSKPRLIQRNSTPANQTIMGFDPVTRRNEIFSGAAWVDAGSSNVSGTVHHWAWARNGGTGNVRCFRDGTFNQNQTLAALVNNGQVIFGTSVAQTEYMAGEFVAFYMWNRQLADTEIASMFSDPFQMFTAPPVADFSADVTQAVIGQTVTFTDASTGDPTSWSWDFGDGGTSTSQNPTHVYNNVGSYTVTLTATNAGGSDPEVKTGYITVLPRPENYAGTPEQAGYYTFIPSSQDRFDIFSDMGL